MTDDIPDDASPAVLRAMIVFWRALAGRRYAELQAALAGQKNDGSNLTAAGYSIVPTPLVERIYQEIALAYTRETGGADLGRRVGEAMARTAIAALAPQQGAADVVLVPRVPTEAMLEAAVPDPVHLYAGRGADYAMQMKAAVTADRIAAELTYRAMIAAAQQAGK